MRHGFLLIDKPKGPTSHDIVGMVRRELGERKIGHLGTLDPAASGLLVLAVGAKALKAVEFFNELPKEYEAEVTFGSVSTTYDAEGTMEEVPVQPGWEIPSFVTLNRLLKDRFTGTLQQKPPAASAIKVGGERAYKKMRQGKPLDLPARTVQIDKCDILFYEYPVARLKVACGSGTYIRSLAHDVGKLLHFGAYLSALRRTKVGEWNVKNAVAPEKAAWGHVLSLKDVMTPLPSIELTAEQEADVRHGRNIAVEVQPDTIGWFNGLPIAVLVPAKDGTQKAHARKVL